MLEKYLEGVIPMTARRMRIANLSEDDLKKVQQLEESMGSLILALEPQIPLAELTDEQVAMVSALEEEIGVILIAYQK